MTFEMMMVGQRHGALVMIGYWT